MNTRLFPAMVLIHAMLHDVTAFSWVRMEHPPQADRVVMPPLPDTGGDSLRCMTMLPYLEDYHNPAPDSDIGHDPDMLVLGNSCGAFMCLAIKEIMKHNKHALRSLDFGPHVRVWELVCTTTAFGVCREF